MNSDQKTRPSRESSNGGAESHTQLLLLPDGRILAHNLTPAMAQILQQLDPHDRLMRQRRQRAPACPPSPIPQGRSSPNISYGRDCPKK